MPITLLRFGRLVASKVYNKQSYPLVLTRFLSTLPKETQTLNENDLKTSEDNRSIDLEMVLTKISKDNEENVGPNLTYISRMVSEGRIEADNVRGDQRFIDLCKLFEKNCRKVHPMVLLNGHRSLLELKVNSESNVVRSIQQEVLWKSRKMNLKALNLCLSIQADHQETETEKNLVKQIVAYIQRRWIEIEDAMDVIRLLDNKSCFNEQFLAKVEDRALDISEKMSIEDLQKMFCCLARNSRRSTPLLRAMAYHFNQCSERLTTKQMVDLLHALNSLNFHDPVMLQKISTNLFEELKVKTITSVISSLFYTFGQMKWRHTDLLDHCCEWICNHDSEITAKEAVSCILSLARLNYEPSDCKNLFKIIKSVLKRSEINNDNIWLDVVWSLCLLKKATKEQVVSVLDPSFYEPLIENAKDFKKWSTQLKLLNVKAVASLELNNLDDALKTDLLTKFETNHVNDKDLNKTVLESLHNFVPRGKFMANNLNTSLGIFIDAEFIMDEKCKPVPLLHYGIKAGVDKDLPALPKEYKRFALLVWNYKDVTKCSQSLIGVNAMTVRILNQLGYAVVEVLLNDFNSHTTAVKKLQFLQQLIKDGLKPACS